MHFYLNPKPSGVERTDACTGLGATLCRGASVRERAGSTITRHGVVLWYGTVVRLLYMVASNHHGTVVTAVSDQFPTTTEPAKTLEALAG